MGNPWLDAGIVPYSTLDYRSNRDHWSSWFPADFITESMPGQFRNWFYSLLAMSTVMENEPPFKRVLGHALVRDDNGEEMHKSKGNSIPFEEAAEKMGADTMRWMFAWQNPFTNINFGYDAGNEVRRRLMTLWNTYKFYVTYASLDGFDPSEHDHGTAALKDMDRWMFARLDVLIRDCRRFLDDYNVSAAVRHLDQGIDELSNWYVRRSRSRFWKSSDVDDQNAAYFTLYTALTTICKLLAPVVPFLTESIWGNIAAGLPDAPESVHLTEFPEPSDEWRDDELLDDMGVAIETVERARATRNKAAIKIRQPLGALQIAVSTEAQKRAVERFDVLICDEMNVKCVEFVDDLGEMVELVAKPNLPVLGPRFGKEMRAVTEIVKALDQSALATFAQDGVLAVQMGGAPLTFSGDELLVERRDREGFAVSGDDSLMVALSVELTDDLRDEGFARELVNKIQNMRKDAGFNVSDRIDVAIESSPRLEQAIDAHREYIINETLAIDITQNDVGADWELKREWSINDEPAEIGVKRV